MSLLNSDYLNIIMIKIIHYGRSRYRSENSQFYLFHKNKLTSHRQKDGVAEKKLKTDRQFDRRTTTKSESLRIKIFHNPSWSLKSHLDLQSRWLWRNGMGPQTQRRTSRVLKCARGENIFNLWNPLSSLWMHFGMIWKELFIEMWMIQAAYECGWVEEPRRGQREDQRVFGIVKRVPPKQKQALRALLQSKLNYLSFWDCLKSSFKTETGFRAASTFQTQSFEEVQ